MDKLLISTVVGLTTYLVLSLNLNENMENTQSGGSQYPECFNICGLAKKVFNDLKKEKKSDTNEFNKLGELYSNVFCFEIALGNNDNKKVEKEKVNNQLKKLKEKYNGTNEENINKYLDNVFNDTEKLIKKISDNKDLISKNKMIKDIHKEAILELLKKI